MSRVRAKVCQPTMDETNPDSKKKTMRLLLIFNAVLLAVASASGSPAGSRPAAGPSTSSPSSSPISTAAPDDQSALCLFREGPRAKLFFMRPPVFLAAAVIGALTGVSAPCLDLDPDHRLAAQLHGALRVPFGEAEFTAYSINAVVLLTIGPGVLALHASSDRPKGESCREYYLGFFMIIGEAALYGLILPMVEMTYKRAKQAITYTLVMEIQLVMCFFATVVCTIGMLINDDFKVIKDSLALSHARTQEQG
ncbi:unnamed protein product [Thlaspi arvense]|uniref:Uncharacterized protein n=1 Tax=Thlaspi arvense TaxID=13288 RepID=A0AAU9RJ60_THLAR|nr:unnamed protein product [Thlaspi arvense]